jgi:hypothetical protein
MSPVGRSNPRKAETERNLFGPTRRIVRDILSVEGEAHLVGLRRQTSSLFGVLEMSDNRYSV